METLRPHVPRGRAVKRDVPKWSSPADFELTLFTLDGEEVATIPLGRRDILSTAHRALMEATAASILQPGDVCRVAGLQGVGPLNGAIESRVARWYLALKRPTGELAKIKEFDISPFADRACREAVARHLEPTRILFGLRKRRDRQPGRMGPMTVALDLPVLPLPDLKGLTLVGEAPLAGEVSYIWPERVLRRFVQFAMEHPAVEVLAAALGRPCWTEAQGGYRILVVEVREIAPVPVELCDPTDTSVEIDRRAAQFIRQAKADIESSLGERLCELGTLHPHLPAKKNGLARPDAPYPAKETVGAFFSITDRTAMFTRYYLPYQIAMIWNVPDEVRPSTGRELARQFQQWNWSSTGNVAAGMGFYLQEGT
jgi:hypothetical protein